MIIFINTFKHFDGIQYAIMKNVLERVGVEGTYQHNQSCIWQTYIAIILNVENVESIPLKPLKFGTTQVYYHHFFQCSSCSPS